MRAAVALALLLLPAPMAWAQEDDRGYLTAFLEDNLSDAGRKVTITGFEGALSSRATMDRIEIADDAGVWIALDDVVLDWSRSSLLSGAVEVNELSAATITVNRLPALPEGDTAPAPEAGGFALPELPVSVDIGQIEATRIILGETVLGEPVEGRFQAALTLAGGEGKADLVLERTDGPVSRIALDAAFSNATGVLALDLQAKEEAGGIAARLLDLPGAPSVNLTIAGTGALSDFAADIRLASDGVERLAGPVAITLDQDGAYRFTAQVAGNLAPLFLPDYAAFLGDRVALDLSGRHWPGGRLALDRLGLDARALDLQGALVVAGDGLPESFDLRAIVGSDDGLPVLLPLPGQGETRLRRGEISLAFDSTRGNGWRGTAALIGLERADLRLGRAQLSGSGRIDRANGRSGIGATLDFAAEGVTPQSPDLQAALGQSLSGSAILYWREGLETLRLPKLTLRGDDYGLEASLRIEGLDSGLNTSGIITLTAEDLARFSGLAGQDLSGAATLRAEGEASGLTGAFDMAAEMVATGLKTGIAQADRLARGTVRLTAAARRDETGITLRALDATAGG
ncbi:MAG: hypothetical protein R3D63_17560 [Paracoccaceae bacterium]